MSTTVVIALAFVLGLVLGALLTYGRCQSNLAALSLERRTQDQMLEALRSASSQVMTETSEQLVSVAEQRYGQLEQGAESKWAVQGKAVTDHLARISDRVEKMEKERIGESATLREQVTALNVANNQARDETRQLVAALRDSRVRGNWGEVQLTRVLELSGMELHRDYVTQSGTWAGEGSGRPDVVVHLPNDRRVVIDAKAPCDRFLDAANTDDVGERARLMAEHAKAVLSHAQALSKRDYATQVGGAADFVVMFLPGEPFLSAALEARPSLYEETAKIDVLIVTPTSLLGLLRAVAVGWREHRLAEDAAEISRLGVELHGRISAFADHFARIGKNLASTVTAFNAATGSMESRLLPSARKLGGLVASKEIVELVTVDVLTREPLAPTLAPTPPFSA